MALKRNNNTSGFTLLEVLVAMAILATGLVALLESHAFSIQSSEYARKMTIAMSLARYKITEIEIGGFPSIGTEDGDFQEDFPDLYPDYRWHLEVQENNFWSYVREVYITVFWQEGELQRSFELADFVAVRNLDEQAQANAESGQGEGGAGQLLRSGQGTEGSPSSSGTSGSNP